MGGQCSSDSAIQGCRDRACCRRDPGNLLQDFSADRLRQHAGMDEWEAGEQDDGPGAAREALEDPSRADSAPPLPRESSELGNDDCVTGIPEMVPEPPELRGEGVSESSKHKIPNLDLKNLDSSMGTSAPTAKQQDGSRGASGKDAQKAGQAAAAVSKAKAKAKTADSKTKTEAKQGAGTGRSSPIPEWLQSLAGLWLDAADMRPLATLQEGKVSWVGLAGQQPSALKPLSGKKFCMAINGKDHVATLRPGSPPRLEWDDKSTWIREELQGTWKNFQEDRMIGQIKGGHIHWDPMFETPEPTPLRPMPPLPQATMTMKLCGEICTGTFQAELPAILKWSDGETWTRVGMTR